MSDITVKIRGMTGVERADIPVPDGKVVILCGLNGAGKTSIAASVTAALTNQPLIRGLTRKGDLKMVVRDGFDESTVDVGKNDGFVSMSWPKGEYATNGNFPKSSVYVAGSVKILKLASAARSNAMMDVLKAHPGEQDLVEWLTDQDFDEEMCKKVWKSIVDNGWDASHKKATDMGAELKGKWDGITGTRWGAKKAQNWIPEPFGPPLLEKTTNGIQIELVRLQIELETKIRDAGYDQAKIDSLKELADRAQEIADTHGRALSARKEAEAALEAVINARNKMASLPEERDLQPCPHCGEDLIIIGNKVSAPPDEEMDEADLSDLKTLIADAEKFIVEGREAVRDATSNESAANQLKNSAAAAVEELQTASVDTEADESGIQSLRDQIETGRKEFAALEMIQQANKCHAAISGNIKLATALSFGGVRARKVGKKVEKFNEKLLAPLCKSMKIKPVSIDANLTTFLGTRQYEMLSGGEQLVVDYILQAAIARTDGSSLIVIDQADTLDKKHRAGLIRMLLKTAIPSIVCMTVSGPDKVPQLHKHDMGATYWLDDGRMQLASEVKAA